MKATDRQLEVAVEKGLKPVEISRMFNMKPHSVRYRLNKLKFKIPDQRKIKRSDRVIKQFSMRQEAIDLIDEIAEQTGKLKGDIVEEAVKLFKDYLEI